MCIACKWQVAIPRDIRKRASLLPHTEVTLEFDGKAVRAICRHRQDLLEGR